MLLQVAIVASAMVFNHPLNKLVLWEEVPAVY